MEEQCGGLVSIRSKEKKTEGNFQVWGANERNIVNLQFKGGLSQQLFDNGYSMLWTEYLQTDYYLINIHRTLTGMIIDSIWEAINSAQKAVNM